MIRALQNDVARIGICQSEYPSLCQSARDRLQPLGTTKYECLNKRQEISFFLLGEDENWEGIDLKGGFYSLVVQQPRTAR